MNHIPEEDVIVELNFGQEGIVVRATRLRMHLGLQCSEERGRRKTSELG
jgi:hypothetical protein